MPLSPPTRVKQAASLTRRTLLLMAMIVTILLSVAMLLNLRRGQERLREQLATRATLLASIQAKAISPALWDFSADTVGAMVAALTSDPDFRFVQVTAADGKVVVARGDAATTDTIAQRVDITYLDKGKVNLIGRLTLRLSTARLQQAMRNELWSSIGALGVILVVLLTALYGALRLIARPLGQMTGMMTRLAAGDTEVEVPALNRRDEIGAMARAVGVFKANAIERARLVAAQTELERRTAEERQATRDGLAAAFESTVRSVVTTVSQSSRTLRKTAGEMKSLAATTEQAARAVSGAATENQGSVQTVATAAEQLSASIGEIAGQVSRASDVARQAAVEAQQSEGAVQALTEAAQEIGEVVALIAGIAQKTNMLALNATIEAARAGEAGKGFAVVASEVKELAKQTAKATQDISGRVTAIHTGTQRSLTAIQRIGQTVAQTEEIATVIAGAVQQQNAATHKIARNVHVVADGTGRITSNIADVEATMHRTGEAAMAVDSAAAALGAEFAQLEQEVAGFIGRIRAA